MPPAGDGLVRTRLSLQAMSTAAIYLDHAATTPVRPEALEAMLPYLGPERFGNPSSAHRFGREAQAGLEQARRDVAVALGAEPNEVVFTSGGTEADNLAVLGACVAARTRGQGMTAAVAATEHKAVLAAAHAVRALGGEERTLPVSRSGLVDLEALDAVLASRPVIVSVMWVNNETGIIQPIEEIASRCAAHGVLFHTDMVQAVGKVPASLTGLAPGLATISGHKLGAPKGVGALIVRKGVELEPIIHGGGQQSGIRPGTENIAAAVALGRAVALATSEQAREARRCEGLRDRLAKRLRDSIPDLVIVGEESPRAPQILNVLIPGTESGTVLMHLDLAGVAASSGSACSTGAAEPSHVLTAMGIPRDLATGTIRFSLGRETTEAEVDQAAGRPTGYRRPGPATGAGAGSWLSATARAPGDPAARRDPGPRGHEWRGRQLGGRRRAGRAGLRGHRCDDEAVLLRGQRAGSSLLLARLPQRRPDRLPDPGNPALRAEPGGPLRPTRDPGFRDGVRRGRTPIPCVRCNSFTKFRDLLAHADALDCDFLATGHYALAREGRLYRGADPAKDQSYFLWGIDRQRGCPDAHPGGRARQVGDPRLCSTAGTGYGREAGVGGDLLRSRRRLRVGAGAAPAGGRARPEPGTPGDVTGEVIGRHEGFARYTIGQRKGLPGGSAHPRFVVEIRPESREVVVGGLADLLGHTVRLEEINWLADPLSAGDACLVQVRHRAAPVRATIVDLGPTSLTLALSTPVRAITPGQSGVLFAEDGLVHGGGVIA